MKLFDHAINRFHIQQALTRPIQHGMDAPSWRKAIRVSEPANPSHSEKQ